MNKRQLYETIMRDVSRTVKQCLREVDTVNESFLNRLLKFGTHADSVVAAIRANIKQYKKEYPDRVSSDINVSKLKWDPKTQYIIWTGKEEVSIGGVILKPNERIVNGKLKEWSSDSEVQKYLDWFNNITRLGRELIKVSSEWKKQEEKRKKDEQERDDNNPELQGRYLQNAIHSHLSYRSEDSLDEEIKDYKKIHDLYYKWKDNKIFKTAYEKDRKSGDWRFDEIQDELNDWKDYLKRKHQYVI